METFAWIIENLKDGQVAKATLGEKNWYIKKFNNEIYSYYGGKKREVVMMNSDTMNASYEIVKQEAESRKTLKWVAEKLKEGQIAKASFGISEWHVIKKDDAIRYFYSGKAQRIISLKHENLQATYEIVEDKDCVSESKKEYRNFERFKEALCDDESVFLKYERIEKIKDTKLIKIFLSENQLAIIDEEYFEKIKNNFKKI